jgi:protoheme IX farnesyltransferase
MSWLFALITFAGVFFDVVVYTLWLKRRSAWSIIWGGIAGGMPVLAGRALALGQVDWIGFLLAGAILFWIPTHSLTFSMRYYEDYRKAEIPTFPSIYGFQITRIFIAVSSITAALVMIAASVGIGLTAGYLRLMVVLSSALLLLALSSMLRPSERLNFGLFKFASLYMLGAMLMIALEML